MVILLGCSALMSASEACLFSLSRHDLFEMQGSKQRLRRLAGELMHRPRAVLLTILITNTVINTLFFASSYAVATHWSDAHPLLTPMWGVATVLLIIVLGEITPKILAVSIKRSAAALVAPMIRGLVILLGPLRWVVDVLIVGPINRLLVGGAEKSPAALSVEELQQLLETSAHQGIIGHTESDMLQEVVALAELKVRTIMVPRVDMISADLAVGRVELLRRMQQHHLTKLPVYHEEIDQLLGLVKARDMYLFPGVPLDQLVHPVKFVPEQMTAEQLLEHFRRTKTQLAIVVDEYGGVAGLVALEDLVEEIIGEIPEPGEKVIGFEELGQGRYRVSGELDVRTWFEVFGLVDVHQRITTLGGLVAAQLGRIPRSGDELRLGNVRLRVDTVRNRRVVSALVELVMEFNE
ncbi:MAG: hypothetical protein HJJLKODD_01275 [Phycisphaerae bacterium]|nr:hypothetical protein [Phycisphaerae bacterium]